MKYQLSFLPILLALMITPLFSSIVKAQDIGEMTIGNFDVHQSSNELFITATNFQSKNGLEAVGGQGGNVRLTVNGEEKVYLFEAGRAKFEASVDNKGKLYLLNTNKQYKLYHISKNADGSYRTQHIPLWLSILPPLIAIALALIFKEVIVYFYLIKINYT